MKTTAEKQESFTDILFAGRNKDYGAYEIRKKYNRYLTLAFCLTASLFITGISVPLIAGYYANHRVITGQPEISVTLGGLNHLPDEETPPPPPPVDKLTDKQVQFLKPIITIDTSQLDENFGRQDVLISTINKPVDTIVFGRPGDSEQPIIEEPRKKEIFTVVEIMPAYPGGEEERLKFMYKNIRYPALANELGIEGTVYIEFVVDETGKVEDVIIKKGIGGGCEEEAARVVKLMKYNPGIQSGVAVPVRFTIPVKFMLKNQ